MKDKKAFQRKNFSEWYIEVIRAADLAEYSPVRGCMVIKPYGYALWENIQKILDEKLKATRHKNAYFPLFIPESFLRKEKEHVKGFSPQLAVVTYGGGKKLEENLIVRPTSETIIYASFSRWIKSWRDLPLLINQWANVVRWELRPRLFLRTMEFLWQEGHTAHATHREAEEEILRILEIYRELVEKYLAIPVISGIKSDTEKFAGALRTFTIEAMTQDKKALQMGTSHDLGQNFARVFNISFQDANGQTKYVWQTSWGVSTRLIGGIIMVHGDEKGVILPPRIAPIQVVIIPVWSSKEKKDERTIREKIEKIRKKLEENDIKFLVDDRDYFSFGEKHYEWEKKGVPIRIEIGPKELNQRSVVLVRRDTSEKRMVSDISLGGEIKETLDLIQSELYQRALNFQKRNTHRVNSWDEFKKTIKTEKGFLKANWCGLSECEEVIKKETKATIRCFPLGEERKKGKCVFCNRDSFQKVIFALSY